ncbi:diazepam-binding inhibitor-like [Pycnococcus provasolii]|uniref:Diazepam-binding inhibitor-like n=1 Tax=Pycnococcus provasolii TaxID=41880 RepID=A0A830H9C0_9CHLO|nr:diazepam-binding inhibitor-like [Pycnococcus provasolii]|eukprot:CAMPEP_0206125806 /NCGR_PEP_ID=MMETSP1472-20131121/18862_1 /ASSEMBLY_ACC=CAM_ASM_001108 /TAXON_ID=41880 /ORGANISM="Pycnococcus provasolii, Strain RCC251" /LENGTH=98 /DNA_ID=CAMNT_0053516765 /DNA_START=23 /DNA_END=319 /DNA_ORIENTATION=-
MAEEQFKRAVYYIKNGPKPASDSSNEVKLAYYKFFKQATVGDVEGSQPWQVQFEARAKWDAWNSVKGMSKEEAMQKYAELLTSETPGWNDHEVMANFA